MTTFSVGESILVDAVSLTIPPLFVRRHRFLVTGRSSLDLFLEETKAFSVVRVKDQIFVEVIGDVTMMKIHVAWVLGVELASGDAANFTIANVTVAGGVVESDIFVIIVINNDLGGRGTSRQGRVARS